MKSVLPVMVMSVKKKAEIPASQYFFRHPLHFQHREPSVPGRDAQQNFFSYNFRFFIVLPNYPGAGYILSRR